MILKYRLSWFVYRNRYKCGILNFTLKCNFGFVPVEQTLISDLYYYLHGSQLEILVP